MKSKETKKVYIKIKNKNKKWVHMLSTYNMWIIFCKKCTVYSYSQSYPHYPQFVWIIKNT